MTLTIYGSARSRTMRTLWVAAELGLAYTHLRDWLDICYGRPAALATRQLYG